MFGHARGAFTGAVRDHVGLVERCHHGTLFLDEVGELSGTHQVKLLRVLQEATFTRVGDSTPRGSDFRLIAATNRNLTEMVADGRFREDLFYRLNVFPIRLPSLRERMEDIPYLVNEILATNARRFGTGGNLAGLTPAALERIKRYRWPGNVRQLENVIMRAAIMAGTRPIDLEHLPGLDVEESQGSGGDDRQPPARGVLRTLAEVERDHIRAVLRAQEGNIRAAAATLDISRTTLYKKIREHGLSEQG